MIPVLIYFGICIAFYGALFLDSYIWKLRERRNHAPRHCAELLRARKKRLIHSRPSTSQVR